MENLAELVTDEEIVAQVVKRRFLEPPMRQRLQVMLQATTQADDGDDSPRLATFEEFIEWVDEDMSAEWVNGTVEIMSPASIPHQMIVTFLDRLIGLFVRERGLGMVLTAPLKMKLEQYGPEPDLVFVVEANKDRWQETYLDGPADLVIEVVSPDSTERDRGRKYVAYEKAGIPEYWLFDPVRQEAHFYRLGGDGHYHAIITEAGRYTTSLLPGFWLQVEWLWADPLPSPIRLLREMSII
jgi:Uma2 family endonuclease